MVNITSKKSSHRIALAEATVTLSSQETVDCINNNLVPKGNIFEMSKAAGLLAVKKTPEILPDCHPIPIESTRISYEMTNLKIKIFVEVETIYKTGVEVEAMHGASVVALNIYDMLKPIDKGIEIQNIRLVSKKGGKTSFKESFNSPIKTAVIVCSDSISAGEKEDTAGKIIIEKLKNLPIELSAYEIIPDERDLIAKKTLELENNSFQLIIFTGGTGLSPRDQTPEALEGILDRRIPGIEEAIRFFGQQRTPYAMLSRSVVGVVRNALVIALPGSRKGAEESIDAIFPEVMHLFKIIKGGGH